MAADGSRRVDKARMIRHGWCFVVLLLSAVTASGRAGAVTYQTRDGIVYAAPEGKALRLTMYQPVTTGTALRPAVVLIHGGAWKFGTRYEMSWYGRHFADRGYVAISIKYRMMMKYPFPKCIHDAKAAVRWLRLHAAEYHVDPNRIAALGESAGGQLATLLATTAGDPEFDGSDNLGPSSKIQAAISLYGATDLTYYKQPARAIDLWGFTPRYMGRFVGEGKPNGGRDPFVVASPIDHASKDTAPTLFIHGTKDHLVPFAQSKAFDARLRRLGVPCELIAVKGRDHGFDHFHHKERRKLFGEMLEFLDRYMCAPRHG